MSRTYTAEQRKQLAKCFRAAKKHLWNGVGNRGSKKCFICFAISKTTSPIRVEARVEVSRRLLPSSDVRGWLLNEAGIPWVELADDLGVQQYRHAWLDSLIAEFEGTEE